MPTPSGVPLEIRGRIEEITERRKVVVSETVSAAGTVCATGRVVAVRLPLRGPPADGPPSPRVSHPAHPVNPVILSKLAVRSSPYSCLISATRADKR